MIQACFIVLTLVMATLVYVGAAKVAGNTFTNPQQQKQFKIRTGLLLTGWLAYVSAISFTGILKTTALPPRIPLLLILPCFAFVFWFFRSTRLRAVIAATPGHWLVYAQSFRIVVELSLHALYLKGLLPRAATFEGYNFEIVIGITALVVGYLGFTRKTLPRTIIVLWNCAGLLTLAIVVFLILSHVYFPQIYTNPAPVSINDFGSFPYTLLAGFLMPLAVFMHVFSLVKARRNH